MHVNSQGTPLGPRGYVLCLNCGKEVTEISKETSMEYARCLIHRKHSQPIIQQEGDMTKEKKARTPGKPQVAIKWFQEAAKKYCDADKITEKAEGEGYSKSTISIQCGRLRVMGLLPALVRKEKVEKKPRVKKEKKVQAKRSANFHPVPKPGQENV